MADTKTSAENAASALSGPELIRGVQGGANVKITATQLSTFIIGAGAVSVASGKTLTASNTLTFTGTDAASVAFGAGGTVLYGNQTITLSGDLTGSGTTSIAATIANNAVTTAKINNGAVTEAKLTLADNTTANVSTSAHGFAPKSPNDATKYLDGTGAYSVPAGTPTVLRSYIAGLALSNDGGTPNSVLDIAAGQAADSTNAVMISIGAFTKSTAGAWAANSGSNGMGNGLTIAASTWYHVILANNGGTPDIYFDTSATGANRPAGISDTKVRRIGSFLTDGSAHIIAFTQVANEFYWSTPVADVNGVTPSTTNQTAVTMTIPLGVKSRLIARVTASAVNVAYVFTGPDDANVAASATVGTAASLDLDGNVNGVIRFPITIYSNTSSQISYRASASGSGTFSISTLGWIDDRGSFN
jgi:hypothetical protein